MPDFRKKLPQLGHSRKVSSLTHFEYRVWDQYLLSANDCGVLLKSPLILQGANLALAREPVDVVAAALERMVELELVIEFDHQGLAYICDPKWQNYQEVQYPRFSATPIPPLEVLCLLSVETQSLFKKFSNTHKKKLPRARARPRNLNPNQIPNPEEGVQGKPEPSHGLQSSGESQASARRRRFEEFWAVYPRKVGLDAAWTEWIRLKPDDEVTAVMIAAVRRQAREWDDPKFTPHPRTWLHQGRWKDEPAAIGPTRAGRSETVWTQIVAVVSRTFSDGREKVYFRDVQILEDQPRLVKIASPWVAKLREVYGPQLREAIAVVRPGAVLELVERAA